ncbi:MAG: zinc-dependent alcohol dehydrogenase [Candidatus Zipacnadales bacterium]
MKAQVFYEPEKMELVEVPDPSCGPTDVVIRVKACGICGSDVAYYFGMSSLETPDGKGPCVLGHEFSGEVVEVGEIPKTLGLFEVGDRVVLDPVQYCNACEVCKRGQPNLCEMKTVLGVSTDGGFAELCRSSYTGVHKLPDNVSYEEGALTEPLACATYAIGKLGIQPGDYIVVYGPGTIGLIMVQLAKARGAGKVVLIGTRDYRLEAGKALGADEVLSIEAGSPYYCEDIVSFIREQTKGKMANGAITATSGLTAMEQALEITGRRATIVYFGLPGDQDRLSVPVLSQILWDKQICFSWLAPNVWPAALQALSSGLVKVAPLITTEYALADLVTALHEVRERKGNPLKPVVKP